MRALLFPLALVAACVDVAPAPRPLEAGPGVRIEDGKVSLDPALQLPDCREGQILTRGAHGWLCTDPQGASIDASKTPVLTGCRTGQVISWTGETWACTDPSTPSGIDPTKTPVLTGCRAGQVISWTGTAWACTDAGTGSAVDATKTPVLSGCAKDAVISWDGTKWVCAVPPASSQEARIAALETRVDSLATSSYETRTATRNATPPGECLSITHGFHTNAIGYAGWLSDARAGWISAQQVRTVPVDLARERPAVSSDTSSSSDDYAVDGYSEGTWWLATYTAGSTWWQVDLGASKPLGFVRVLPEPNDRGPGGGTTAWNILVSDTTTFTGAPVASGSCTWGTSCRAPQVLELPPGTRGRYVRYVPTAVSTGSSNAVLAEFEAYAPRDPIVVASIDELRLCNVTDVPRDLILRVWK